MQELHDWIDEKLTHNNDTIFAFKSVTHEYKKVSGLCPYAGLIV